MWLIDFIIAKYKYIKNKKRDIEEYHNKLFEKGTKDSVCNKCKFAYVNDWSWCKCGISNGIIENKKIEKCEYFKENEKRKKYEPSEK